MKKLQVKKESILNLRNDASAMVKGGKGGKVEESTDTLSPVSGRGSREAACQTHRIATRTVRSRSPRVVLRNIIRAEKACYNFKY